MGEDPFLKWGLQSVELTDRPVFEPYFSSLQHPISDYTFPQLFTWRNSLRILWRILDGHLCVFANGTGDLTLLMPPIGDTRSDAALTAAFELMDDYNAQHGVPDRSRVEYVSDELLSRFDRSRLVAEAMGFDYVYRTDRMIDLAGGDLASKRQAKNRFLRLYDHRVESYDAKQHLAQCKALLSQWRHSQDESDAESGRASTSVLKRSKETRAAELSLEVAQELGLVGRVIQVREGDQFRVAGFTFGEPLGADQSSITIEKTDLSLKGLAQFIFSEFCQSCWSDRPLVNVGDDWGLETLAWTKMSYRPVKLLQKYVIHPASRVQVAVPSVQPMAADAIIDPAPVQVRLADRRDVTAACELEKACFSPSVSLKKRQLQYLQSRRSAIFLVAEQSQRIIGEGIALVRQHRHGRSGRIYSLAVHESSRGRRVGEKLLNQMLDALRHRGVQRVYLEVHKANAGAIRLYERAGFRSIGALPNYYGAGEDAIHMMIEAAIPAPATVPPALSIV